ncbi:MAG: hypothetical protein PHN84_06895 [Desulfuromonadaceae bacterium]|nr:hypothetical protein [Desulfuromonadaceae bacterium]MDD2854162.1 hypothetical protein [Desulfuromonadaceae bacterium]
MIRKVAGSIVAVALTAGFAVAAVNVDVKTPSVRVQVGTPQAPPPQQVRVIERERVIVKEKEYSEHKDNGKHKGQKKGKKHHKQNKHDKHEHDKHDKHID